AWQAAAWEVPAVFCPPLVTFHTGKDAKTENVSEGVAISVECDERPVVTQQILQGLLGDPTIIVASGGEWIDNETGEVEPKVHMHWRLTTPVSSPAQQARLREARDLAAKLVGSDYTAVPLVHPLRWPGSWHRKQTPRLAKIVFESENEVDLDEALERLRDVTGAWSISEQFRHDFSASHQTNPKLLAEKVEYVASALRVIPNNNLKWCDWNYVGLAIWGATGGSAEGFKAFADWSAKAPKNIVANTEERWAHFAKSPPDRIGFGTLVYLARQSDPSWDFEGSTSVAEPADPIDLWAKFEPPTLPRGVLPNIIERFAFDQGVDMGADMAGIAVSALAVCAAAIPDKVQLQVKRHHNGWLESARLWVALVGPPSTMKSPIMAAAVRPLRQIDAALARDYAEQRAEYDKLGKEEKAKNTPPKQTRLLLQDTTIEAAQEILKDSPDGMLCYQDEMSGWFGSMDKYSGGRGAAKDRAFWLESYNGSPYSVNRIGRGAAYIDNLSISLIGGIQSEPIRKLAEDSVDDGLLQRLLPIVLAPAVIGRDEEMSTVVSEYGLLIERLHSISAKILKLDEGGQCYRQELERRHLDLQSCEAINPKLAAHIGKYNGLFARLCVIWHCVEAARRVSALDLNSPDPATIIPEATARRVGAFLHGFLLPHAIAFYAGMLGLSNDHERLTAVAGYILAHKLERLSNRDIQRGDRTMRKLGRQEIDVIFDHLDALGWIDRIPGRRIGAHHWAVNPVVHTKFAKRAAAEAERRAREREIITGLMGMKNEAD